MADLRLIAALTAAALAGAALAAAGLAGCGRAGAAPDQASGLSPPAGWQALPDVAAAAREALGAGAEVDGAEAWGEPAMGCYAVWLALRASGAAEAIAPQVVAGFTAVAAGVPPRGGPMLVEDVAAPSGDEGVLALAFERGDHRGRLRARIGGGRIAALACFANRREPLACETTCTALLGALR